MQFCELEVAGGDQVFLALAPELESLLLSELKSNDFS